MSWWRALLFGFLVSQVAALFTTVYMHRCVAHRALTMHPLAAWASRFLLWGTIGVKLREWAAVHRRHHAVTDTPADPHSPLVLGFWPVMLGNYFLYRRATHDAETVRRYGRDLEPDAWDRWLFNRSGLGLAFCTAMFCVALGWKTGLVATGFHFVFYVAGSGAINAVGHVYGSRPFDNSGTNSLFLAAITGGEGYHNNHHAAPTSARFSLGKRQFDPGWLFIRLLSALGLTKVRHTEPKFV